LLMFCLQSISKRGHHREIATHIDQSNYFGVFNAMLASELSIIGKIAIGGELDQNCGKDISSFNIGNMVSDFKRVCNSTSYTHLHALEVLDDLINRVKSRKVPADHRAVGIRRLTRKWETLKDDLEEDLIHSTNDATSRSPFAKKRRVDICLTICDLYQRQRRRLNPMTACLRGEISDKLDPEGLKNSLESGIITLLKKQSLDLQIDEEIADMMLNGQHDDLEDGTHKNVGELLIAHPSSVKALLGFLFKPGDKRIKSIDTRKKCATLLALSVIAARRAVSTTASKEISESSLNGKRDEESLYEDELSKQLLKASQLSEKLEESVSFTVSENPIYDEDASMGQQISYLCIKYAPVAQGLLVWCKELSQSKAFTTSTAYANLAECFLGLLRIISIHHPFTRQKVQNLALVFLQNPPPDLSFHKAQELKQKVLRLFLFLCTQGQAFNVFSLLTSRLQNSSTDINSVLLRYFMSGCLDIIRPPISIPLIKCVGKMLSTKNCLEALRGQYFPEKKKLELKALIGQFQKAVKDRQADAIAMVEDNDVKLVQMLGNLYGTIPVSSKG